MRRDEHLYCPKGDMWMSQGLENLLTEAIESTSVVSLSLPLVCDHSNVGYCPRCRQRLVKLSADVYALTEQCPQCSLTITPAMVHHLVERHPHQSKGPDERAT